MEARMKAICDGNKSRNDAVIESIDQYKEMYLKTARQIDMLKTVS
jgi:DNA topoisomerase III